VRWRRADARVHPGQPAHNRFTNGGAELFDVAARGKIGAFFLSGGQIDGQANINLVGTGDYPQTDVRWSGSFGSAYLYFMVPRVILFRWEHSRRTLVRQVDFISAPGVSEPGVHRPGGPIALMTNLCLFRLRSRRRAASCCAACTRAIRWKKCATRPASTSTAPATTCPPRLYARRAAPGSAARAGGQAQIADIYPAFARQVFGAVAA
jgi:glutaconate CoA-transferase subunit B